VEAKTKIKKEENDEEEEVHYKFNIPKLFPETPKPRGVVGIVAKAAAKAKVEPPAPVKVVVSPPAKPVVAQLAKPTGVPTGPPVFKPPVTPVDPSAPKAKEEVKPSAPSAPKAKAEVKPSALIQQKQQMLKMQAKLMRTESALEQKTLELAMKPQEIAIAIKKSDEEKAKIL
tara:strand:+ start:965 stop:1480 length:516 start_codon:yes stop_codon:yes gene_type:complete